jgi:uridine kinase
MKKDHPKETHTGQVFVIAVSGTSGAGKTAVVNRVAALLGNVVLLHFDDYVVINNNAADIRVWLEGGASPDEFKTPRLPGDLRKLIAGEIVQLQDDRGLLEPAEFILIEEPFGRSRSEIGSLIAFAVHLDVPADVAIARRIIRAIEAQPPPEDEAMVRYVHHELKTYLAAGREAYIAAESAAIQAADMVLDGLQSVDEIAAEIVTEIHRRRQ